MCFDGFGSAACAFKCKTCLGQNNSHCSALCVLYPCVCRLFRYRRAPDRWPFDRRKRRWVTAGGEATDDETTGGATAGGDATDDDSGNEPATSDYGTSSDNSAESGAGGASGERQSQHTHDVGYGGGHVHVGSGHGENEHGNDDETNTGGASIGAGPYWK